jgi:hypothetical protein
MIARADYDAVMDVLARASAARRPPIMLLDLPDKPARRTRKRKPTVSRRSGCRGLPWSPEFMAAREAALKGEWTTLRAKLRPLVAAVNAAIVSYYQSGAFDRSYLVRRSESLAGFPLVIH